MRAAYMLIPSVGILAACSTAARAPATSVIPRGFEVISHSRCYSGAGFFRVPKSDLQRRLPTSFVVRDGSLMGGEYAGYGLLVVAYYECPRAGGGSDGFAILATPIEDPEFAPDLRPVRWNWYEFGRVANTRERVERAREQGLSAELATFSHPPFQEGDRTSSYAAAIDGRRLFEVRAALTDSVNFQAQSHRFWHRNADGHLASTRLDFGDHHSWIGRFDGCSFEGETFAIAELSSIKCTGIGVTEAIESIQMSEHVIRWR